MTYINWARKRIDETICISSLAMQLSIKIKNLK